LKKEELEIFESKERLANDLNMQRTEVESIKREKLRIYEEKRQLIRDLELAENQMQECAIKQSEMSKTIRLLKEKIKVME